MNAQLILNDLRNLDRENPGNWPLWFRVAVVVIVFVAVLAAGFYYLIIPRTEELARAEAEENTLFQDFSSKAKKAASLELFKEQLTRMEQEFADLLKQLPGRAEVPNLLDEISRVRIASALREELFEPQGDHPKEFYAEIPSKTTVVGSFHELGTFVSGIASLTRIVTVEDVDLKPFVAPRSGGAPAPSVPTPGSDLRMNATIKTYRYLEEGEGTAPVKPKGPPRPAAPPPAPATGHGGGHGGMP
jgi:type IV pilus assembly protein PilO